MTQTIRVAPRDKTFDAKVIRAEANDVEERDGVVLFWGGWPSQWYPSQFTINGFTYNCAEQWMMAEKARTFGDTATLAKILSAKYPKAQKELGRSVTPFNPAKWDRLSRDVVYQGNLHKFAENPALGKLLKATGKAKIGEASPYDDLWGIGMDAKAKGAFNPATWKGKNWLGEALMRVRKAL